MIEINVPAAQSDLDAVKERVALMRERFKDTSGGMKQVSVMLDKWTKENFKTQGGKVGGWPAFTYGGRLAPFKPGSRGGVYAGRGGKLPPKANAASAETRRGINTNAKLLQDTGALRLSTLPFASNTEAGIGSFLPYSKTHQEGTTHVPQRRFLPEADEVAAEGMRIFENWARVQLKELFKEGLS